MQVQAPPNLPLWLVLWLQLGQLVQEQLSRTALEQRLDAAHNWTASGPPPPPPPPPSAAGAGNFSAAEGPSAPAPAPAGPFAAEAPPTASPAPAAAGGQRPGAAAACPAWEPPPLECPAVAAEPEGLAAWGVGPLLWWAGQLLGGAAWRLAQARRAALRAETAPADGAGARAVAPRRRGAGILA